MKDVGVVLFGVLKGDAKAPRRACVSKEPCAECKKLMELGIILISVDEKKSEGDMQNPYRTGGWCVVKEEAVRRMFEGGPILDSVLKYRMAFIEDEAWDKLGLPRGEPNAQSLPRPEKRWPIGPDNEERIAFLMAELAGKDVDVEPWSTFRDELEWRRTDSKVLERAVGEEREVVGDLMGNDWREGTTAEELEGMKMIVFLQKLSGVDETEEKARAGWRAMSNHEREQTKLAYKALEGDRDKT